MEYYEILYNSREEQQRVIDEAPFILKYNHDVDIINEAIAAIINKIRKRRPEKCEWISFDKNLYAAWAMFRNKYWKQEIISNYHDNIYLLSDGKLCYIERDGITPYVVPNMRDNSHLLNLKHINKISDHSLDLSLYVVKSLRVGIIRRAQEDFNIPLRRNWVDVSKDNIFNNLDTDL